VRVSRQLDHPHVIKLIDAYVPPTPDFDHVYLLFEHMHLSLWKVRMHKARHSPHAAAVAWKRIQRLPSLAQVAYGKYDLSPVQIQWLVYQLVCGIHYLHSLGVMHRDLAVRASRVLQTPPALVSQGLNQQSRWA
jgi:serine/threonine protein kinase